MCQFRDHAQPITAVYTQAIVFAQHAESQGLQCIAGEDGGGLIVGLVARGPAPSQIVVVHRREVVMHERVGVNQLHGTCGAIETVGFCAERLAGGIHEDRTDTLAVTECSISHRPVQPFRLGGFRRQPLVERLFDPHPAIADKYLKSGVKRHLRTALLAHPGFWP